MDDGCERITWMLLHGRDVCIFGIFGRPLSPSRYLYSMSRSYSTSQDLPCTLRTERYHSPGEFSRSLIDRCWNCCNHEGKQDRNIQRPKNTHGSESATWEFGDTRTTCCTLPVIISRLLCQSSIPILGGIVQYLSIKSCWRRLWFKQYSFCTKTALRVARFWID
jgi:hypothetical protein